MKETHSKMNRLKSAGKYSTISNELISVMGGARGASKQGHRDSNKKVLNKTIIEQIE